MIGPQNGVVKAELGALLNGLVNYEYWLPVPSLMNPQIQSLIAANQSRAEQAGADPLGYYVAPLAYAQLQVLEQAIRAVGSTDDAALSDYTPRLCSRMRRHEGRVERPRERTGTHTRHRTYATI